MVYDHEPFVTFASRVVELAVRSIWPGAAEDEIAVERMQGGGFNRIIGLDRHHRDGSGRTTRHILRIPRFDSAQVGNDVAILRFLHQKSNIPAPEVVMFDEGDANALESPYAVQTRIQGVGLHSSFPNLGHAQKCRVARELGAVFNQMLSVGSSVAGKLVLPPEPAEKNAPVYVLPLGCEDAGLEKPYSDGEQFESTHDLLKGVFLARKASDEEKFSKGTVVTEHWDKFCQMTLELDAGGWLSDTRYSIAHLDFAPRNILVDPTSDTQAPIVTGILDWDSAVLAPRFMSCTPPMWIWAWQDDEDEDERLANDDPGTAEGRELKALFEEAVGGDYVRLAYEPVYRLARRLVRFAVEGLRFNEDFREADAMIEEWAVIYESSKPKH